MKTCPNCGKKYDDNTQYCIECGASLQKSEEPTRTSIIENIRYAFNVATSNIKIFYPQIAILAGSVVIGIVFIIGFGLSFIGSTEPMMPTFSPMLIIMFFVVWVIGMYLGVIATPFFQNVYKNAVLGEEISFKVSFKYGQSMFVKYLGAILAFIVLLVPLSFGLMYLSLPYMEFPTDVYTYPEQIDYVMLFKSMWWFVFLIPLFAVFMLSFYIMAWDTVGLFPALRSSLTYLRNRFTDLLILVVLEIVVSIILLRVPLGLLFSQVLATIFNLALIDNYLNYQRIKLDASITGELEPRAHVKKGD